MLSACTALFAAQGILNTALVIWLNILFLLGAVLPAALEWSKRFGKSANPARKDSR